MEPARGFPSQMSPMDSTKTVVTSMNELSQLVKSPSAKKFVDTLKGLSSQRIEVVPAEKELTEFITVVCPEIQKGDSKIKKAWGVFVNALGDLKAQQKGDFTVVIKDADLAERANPVHQTYPPELLMGQSSFYALALENQMDHEGVLSSDTHEDFEAKKLFFTCLKNATCEGVINDKNVRSLIRLAEWHNTPWLIEACEDYLIGILNKNTMIPLLEEACCDFQSISLMKHCEAYIVSHIDQDNVIPILEAAVRLKSSTLIQTLTQYMLVQYEEFPKEKRAAIQKIANEHRLTNIRMICHDNIRPYCKVAATGGPIKFQVAIPQSIFGSTIVHILQEIDSVEPSDWYQSTWELKLKFYAFYDIEKERLKEIPDAWLVRIFPRILNKTLTLNKILINCRTLAVLDLSGSNASNSEAIALAEALKVNNKLTSLILENNNIGASGVEALFKALEINSTLRSLDLRHNHIWKNQVKVLEALGKALKKNQALNTLYLGDNYINNSDDGMNDPENLDFNDPKDLAAFSALTEGLKVNSGLSHLDLKGNWIGDLRAIDLAEALKGNNHITILNLGENKIGDIGAKALFEALKVNRTLQSLDMSCNKIGYNGPAALISLAEALTRNRKLTRLDLTENYIRDAGAGTLSRGLKENFILTELYLSRNGIQDVGVSAIAETLLSNKVLETLYLTKNLIGSEGAKKLADALKENHTLKLLQLADNRIGRDETKVLAALAAMDEALKANKVISIRLAWNDIGLGKNRIGAEERDALELSGRVNFNIRT